MQYNHHGFSHLLWIRAKDGYITVPVNRLCNTSVMSLMNLGYNKGKLHFWVSKLESSNIVAIGFLAHKKVPPAHLCNNYGKANKSFAAKTTNKLCQTIYRCYDDETPTTEHIIETLTTECPSEAVLVDRHSLRNSAQ